MRYPLTIDGIERVMRLLGHEWRRPWQREAALACVNHREVVIQGPRQVFGKTFVLAVAGATSLICGNTHAIGFPTLTQSTRILARETGQNVDRIASYFSGDYRKTVDTITERMWRVKTLPDYQPRLLALSTNEISRSKPEGYTTDTLAIDESHRSTPGMLAIFSPFLNVARMEGRDHIWYSGVGGHKASLIEERKTHAGVKVVRWPASQIVEAAPEWKDVFDRERESLSDWQWRQHYECLPATEGMRLMFPDGIPDGTAITAQFMDFIKRGLTPMHYFGIDVGKVIDSTVVKVISVIHGKDGPIINEVDTFEISGVSYMDQAAAIYKWIDGRYYWRKENIIVELNGPGQAFYDILNDAGFRGIRGINTTADLKEMWWNYLNSLIRNGQFGCKREESRLHYEGMMYENVYRGGKFVMDFEHSDYWMGLNMALAGLSDIEAL